MADILKDSRYATRIAFRGWNIRPTVLQEPRLFPRIFPELDRGGHEQRAKHFAAEGKKVRAEWHGALERAEKKYGSHGALISGGFRDHWPEVVKDKIRELAHDQTKLFEAAEAHWKAAGKRPAPPWRA